MVLKLDEITARLREQIESFEAPVEVADVGQVLSVGSPEPPTAATGTRRIDRPDAHG